MLELGSQQLNQVAATAGVTPLVVVPSQNFHAAIADDLSVLGIHDGGIRIALEVGGNELFFVVAENTFHWSVGGSLQRCFFFIVTPTTDIYTLSLHDAD